MKPEFTHDENRLLNRYLHARRGEAWGWLLVFSPLVAFACYGVWRHDAIAVAIAWAGTTGWTIWWFATATRNAAILRRVLEKYAHCVAEPGASDDGGAH